MDNKTIAKYPNGFSGGVAIRGMPILNSYSGKIFWVDSATGSNGNRGTFDRPFATAQKGHDACSAGDIVVLKAGHAETIAAAGGLTLSTAGVSMIGLGVGAKRPTFTVTLAGGAGTILMSGASCSMENIIAVCGTDAATTIFSVTAANVYLDVETQDTSSLIEAARSVLTTADATNFVCKLKHVGFPAGNAGVNCVRLVGTVGADIQLDYYGKASTSVVEFVTTLSSGVKVSGYMYNSGTTDGSKNVVDTIGSSVWYAVLEDGAAGAKFSGGSASALASDDASAIAALLVAPTADVTTTTNMRDSVGIKTDAAVTAVGTTKSVMAYAKGLVTMATVQSADSTNNAFAGDVVGNKTDASVYVPGTTKSVAAYVKGTANLQEGVAAKAAAVMVNADTLFTVAGGPIKIEALWSECVTANDATASTLQYSCTPTAGAAQTISGASASLANAAAGASVSLAGTALATAALYNANGPNLIANPGTIVAPAGTIKAVIAVGSTTGTWRHYIRYKPLAVGVTVS